VKAYKLRTVKFISRETRRIARTVFIYLDDFISPQSTRLTDRQTES